VAGGGQYKLSLAGEGVDEVDGCGQATERSPPPKLKYRRYKRPTKTY